MSRTFYEFFAGGGMARAGLGAGWKCLFANDIDAKKAETYISNWGKRELRQADIYDLHASDLPGRADLAWASFPCQDLSLAGSGAGLKGARSGTFWEFHRLMFGLAAQDRAPRLLVLENVCGALTSHGGRDFAEICHALALLGYDFGALVMDAAHFLPQSRPRLFIVAARRDGLRNRQLCCEKPQTPWHPETLQRANSRLRSHVQKHWVWWRLPPAPIRQQSLSDLIEDQPVGVEWRSKAETERLIGLMSDANRAKLEMARRTGRRETGAVYRRTRVGADGVKKQRAEVRFDEMAGCLRTPAGGSSRQTILVVEGDAIKSRLLSTREAARLMGLPDAYRLPTNYNDAYHIAGDGVAVPVVAYLAKYLLSPLMTLPALPVAAE